ncbi:glycosyl hydrolase [Flammeovirga aprica]|uniref:Uncharacterized protein n=1 Tax=Flammeovirga aprica JL-4 TaxID=694437 RepID=A0A7X9XBC3_9BACT|nr:glycosyl hydrolase [Flammeovirga aprica]NME70587.1 hypothetical protein [Flammeovirga aprica JL-4]
MKKIAYKIAVLLPILFIMMSCDLDDMINNRPVPGEEEITPEVTYNKKGYGQTLKSPIWSNCVANVLPHWHYSWGSDYPADLPDNVEFVPMLWGRNDVAGKVEKLKVLAAEGKIKYLLGFNEPDKEDQSHMSVEEAIELWPLLETVGVPLGSPAPASMSSGWLDDFMSQANAKGLRVDFICMHRYTDSIDPNKWMEAFQTAHTKWGLPVWITEMGLADWTATSPETNRRTKEQAFDLMEALLPMMDQASYIERYAWFDGGRAKNQAALHISTIYESNTDMLTNLGKLYAEHDPNLKTGSGNGELPEAGDYGLVVDGGFEFRNIDGAWLGYDNGFTDETTARQGLISGKIQADKNGDGGSMLQAIEVEPNTVYEFKYSTKWAETPDGTITVQVQDRTPDKKPEAGWERLYAEEISTDTDWADVTTKFTTGPNTTSAYLVFYKGGTNDNNNAGLTVLYIDEVAVFKTDEEVEPTPDPNPVPDSGLITDGGFESATAGPFPSEGDAWYGFDGNFVNNVADAHTGEKYAVLATDNNADGAFLNQKVTTVQAYKQYTLDLHSKWGTAPTTAGIVKVFDVTGGGKVELLNSNYASDTDWANSSFTFETGENAAEIQITIIKPGAEAENTVMIDDVLLFETGDVTPDLPNPNPVPDAGLMTDGGFEGLTAGPLPDTGNSWYGFDGSFVQDVVEAHTGEYYALLSTDNNADGAFLNQKLSNVKAYREYTLDIHSKWGTAPTAAGIVKVFDVTGGGKVELLNTNYASQTEWTNSQFTFETGENTAEIQITIIKPGAEAENTVMIDDVLLFETADLTPVPPAKVNLVQAGDFESLTAGALKADSSPWSGYNSGTADVVTSALATPYEGDQCGRLKKDEASIIQTIAVEEGKTYVFSLFTKWSDGPGKDLKFTIKASNDNGFKTQETINASTDWAETTFEYTVPAGHTSLTFNIYKGKDNAAGFFYLDNVAVTEK